MECIFEIENKVIRSVEYKLTLTLIIWEVIYFAFRLSLSIIAQESHAIQSIQNIIVSSLFCLLFIILSLSQFYLYRQLSKILQNNLHFYFKQNWQSLSFLMLMNTLYYFIWIIWYLIFAVFNLNANDMFTTEDTSMKSNVIRSIFLVSKAIVNICLYLFVLHNFKGINFKDWICDLYQGYKIPQHYANSSLFITLNKYYIEITETESLSCSSKSDVKSISEANNSIQIDYEVNDDFMKNFKAKLINTQGYRQTDLLNNKSEE